MQEWLDPEASHDLLVLMKIGLARFQQGWHYHLANGAGRPRCGALLNLREWQVRAVAVPPTPLCGRCARLLHPAKRAIATAANRATPLPAAGQMGLPLDDDVPEDDDLADETLDTLL